MTCLRRLLSVALLLGLAAFTSSQASADPFYTAVVSLGCCTSNGTANSTTPVAGALNLSVPGVVTMTGSAIATDGHLGAALNVDSGICCSEGATTSYTFDVMFSATRATLLTSIPVALNLGINGSLVGSGSFNTSWTVNVAFAHAFSGSIQSDIEAALHQHIQSGIALTSGIETLVDGSDTVHGVLTTDFVDLPLNVMIPITVGLNVGGFANPGTYTDSFQQSLDFVTGTDLFSLPDGFTANDPNNIIVNNRFSPAVPELSTWAMIVLGFACIGFVAYRRPSRANC
jgi:hypothetical protein